MPENDARRLTRRTLLAAGAAAGVTACAPKVSTGNPMAATSSPPPATAVNPSATPTPTPEPATPTATPTPGVPSRADIVARFSGRTPKHWSNGEFAPFEGLLRRTPSDKVVLTLDCCGGPGGSGVDAPIFDLLRRERIPAVLFLNKRWIQANRPVFDRFAAEPDLFEIGNHGTRHTPLSVNGRSQYKEPGTKNVGEVYDEVMDNHLFLTQLLGRPPRFFRTGTAWYDEVALDIVHACGEIPVGFDTNGDAGTTYTQPQVVQETARAKPGSIVILHANQPKHATYEGLAAVLPRMKAGGVKFATLSDAGV